jgi:hypothetical protein
MIDVATDPLENLIRDSGQGWLIDWYAPKDAALSNLRSVLEQATAAGKQRLGAIAPDLSPETLIAAYQRNPHKVTAFLQVIGSIRTPDFLVMVWRILQGMNVGRLSVEYRSEQRFKMQIELNSPNESGVEPERYESENIDDSVILRHLGTMKMDGKPVFDGFYPLNLQDERTRSVP